MNAKVLGKGMLSGKTFEIFDLISDADVYSETISVDFNEDIILANKKISMAKFDLDGKVSNIWLNDCRIEVIDEKYDVLFLPDEEREKIWLNQIR
jgi:uncharacterized protein YqfA (UPF0365 family)